VNVAQQMRELALKVRKKRMKKLMKAIRTAAEKGETVLKWDGCDLDRNRTILGHLGFKIELGRIYW